MTNIWDRVESTEEVKSPCNGNCIVSSTTGYCSGCYMTIRESQEWDTYSNETKLSILELIAERKKHNVWVKRIIQC